MVTSASRISQGLVQRYNLEFSNTDRRGRILVPHTVRQASAPIRRAREATLGVKRAKIFNLLQVWTRNMNGDTVDGFEYELDKFLSEIPD